MIIGISGAAGAGKDTVADILVSKYGFLKGSMALPLRMECAMSLEARTYLPGAPADIQYIINTVTAVDVWSKPTSLEARRLLQWYGAEYRRDQDPDYWVKRTEPVLDHVMDFVITDIRFPNEADMIRRHSGKMWLVNGNHAAMDAVMDRVARTHVSEKFHESYRLWDAVVDNNCDRNELENKVTRAFLDCYSKRTDDPPADPQCKSSVPHRPSKRTKVR